MDSVPLDFCERVSATRKCCEREYRCSCSNPVFVGAPAWNQAMERTMPCISFFIGAVDGKWKYTFSSETRNRLSMDELMTFPNLKNVRVTNINVLRFGDKVEILKHNVVEMEKLLKLVSFLSNEPHLDLQKATMRASIGQMLLKWLTETLFSQIRVSSLWPKCHPIIERQISRWTSTQITVHFVNDSKEFLTRHLSSGALRRLSCFNEECMFQAVVLRQIVESFLDASDDKNDIDIQAYFRYSAEQELKRMISNGLCTVEVRPKTKKYVFNKQSAALIVERFKKNLWKMYSEDVGLAF